MPQGDNKVFELKKKQQELKKKKKKKAELTIQKNKQKNSLLIHYKNDGM